MILYMLRYITLNYIIIVIYYKKLLVIQPHKHYYDYHNTKDLTPTSSQGRLSFTRVSERPLKIFTCRLISHSSELWFFNYYKKTNKKKLRRQQWS